MGSSRCCFNNTCDDQIKGGVSFTGDIRHGDPDSRNSAVLKTCFVIGYFHKILPDIIHLWSPLDHYRGAGGINR